MARYAVMKDGEVVNIIMLESHAEWTRPEGHTMQILEDDSEAGIGHTFDGQKFISPFRPVEIAEPETPAAFTFEPPTPDPLTYNAVGYSTVAQGPLVTGRRAALDGKPGIWLIGDKIPGIEGYSVTRVA